MVRYKAAIFDLFGTLVNDLTVSDRNHEQVLVSMAHALAVPPQEFVRLWAVETWQQRLAGAFPTPEANIEYICQALGAPVPATRIRAAARLRRDFMRRALIPPRNVTDTLARLGAAGYKKGLITNCAPDVPLLWRETPLATLIDVPIFSCVVGLIKPDPRIYQLAWERLAVKPEECLYVSDGDSRELTGAAAAGIHAVLVRVLEADGPAVYRPDADEWQGCRISRLSDVLTLVGR